MVRWDRGFVMKLFLSVGAIMVTLIFGANAEPQALSPNLWNCFDLLRLESLQNDPQTNTFSFNTRDLNQITLLNHYFGVSGWLRGFFTGLNLYGFSRPTGT
jgi:hypothetical protein